MRSSIPRQILLAQSIEKADPDGRILSLPERHAATREAARTLARDPSTAEQDRFLGDRATRLLDRVASLHPGFREKVQPARRLRALVPLALAGALLIGWLSQALGPQKLINILSFPLLGILGWNLAVYLLELMGALWSRRTSHPESDSGEFPHSGGWIDRLAEWADTMKASGNREEEGSLPPAIRLGLTEFYRRWRRLHHPVVHARLRAGLHLAAALLAASALAGMYAKGIANEYRAYWESTFFSPESLRRTLGVVLGPASAASGIAIPDADSLAALRRSADDAAISGENAARWIHLYAATIALFVIIPRLVLAAGQGWIARRREAALDPRTLPGTGMYFDRILAEALGTALPIRTVAYCHRLSPTGEDRIQHLLEEKLGLPVRLDWAPPLPLGDELPHFHELREKAHELPAHLAYVFDFAATPEEESHGDLIRHTLDLLRESGVETALHLCLDAEGFDESRRALPDFTSRRTDRLSAWLAVAGPARDLVLVPSPHSSKPLALS